MNTPESDANRQCRKCNQILPIERFHLINKPKKDGTRSRSRTCGACLYQALKADPAKVAVRRQHARQRWAPKESEKAKAKRRAAAKAKRYQEFLKLKREFEPSEATT